MAIDPELLRCDLLRIKRKLFLTYPEGSRERAEFLKASKLSELNYLTKLVSPDVADLVFEEHYKIIKEEIQTIVFAMLFGIAASAILWELHIRNPKMWILYLFSVPFWIALSFSLKHIGNIVEQNKSIKPFKEEYSILKGRINKLIDEMGKME